MTNPTSHRGPRPWVGLFGPAGAGKDTLAKFLEPYGFQRVAFADPVREAALALDPLVPHESIITETPEGHSLHTIGVHSRLSYEVNLHGWEEAKRRNPEVRRTLQRLGTDAIRTQTPDYWVDLGIKKALELGGPIVFTDTRFPNEVEAITRHGGLMVKVLRDVDAIVSHVSERALDLTHAHYTVHNDGLLEDLEGHALTISHHLIHA